ISVLADYVRLFVVQGPIARLRVADGGGVIFVLERHDREGSEKRTVRPGRVRQIPNRQTGPGRVFAELFSLGGKDSRAADLSTDPAFGEEVAPAAAVPG